jgi:glycosyltransferase involved in cell wall biosynthesis
MKNKIAYINFHPRSYLHVQDFFAEQNTTLSYKTVLSKSNTVHYLINNNLSLDKYQDGLYLISKRYNSIFFLMWVVKYVRLHKYDYIIIHGLDYFIQAVIIKWFSGQTVILQHHAEKTYLMKKSLLMPWVDRWIDAYLFNGKKMAQPFLQKKCISSIDKVYEVVEGSSNFQLSSNTKTNAVKQLVFIGRLNENKNLITLLKAITILKIQRSDFHLSVYYTSNEQELELKDYCAKNQINHLVTFKGSVAQNKIESILNLSDIFISCSLYEGSGYSLIEALACGVFPIASHIPAFDYILEELVEKEQFNPLDEKELAGKINKSLNREFTSAHKHAIRNHFENKCSNKAITLQLEQVMGYLR